MHGMYRVVNYPPHPHGDMIAATLWAGDASAISHESALVVYGLASAMPSAIHLTVPRSFTGTRPGIRLHHQDLGQDERRLWDDVPASRAAHRSAGRLASGFPRRRNPHDGWRIREPGRAAGRAGQGARAAEGLSLRRGRGAPRERRQVRPVRLAP